MHDVDEKATAQSGGRLITAFYLECDARCAPQTGPAGAAVAARPDVPTAEVAGHLGTLVDKSMVQFDHAGTGPGRYRLLDTVRQYAAGQLDAQGPAAVNQARAARLDYYLALAEEAGPRLVGPDQAAWLDRLDAEPGNLRAAIDQDLADLGETLEPLEARLASLDRQRLRAAMGAEAFDAEYAAGRALDPAQVLAALGPGDAVKEVTVADAPRAGRAQARRPGIEQPGHCPAVSRRSRRLSAPTGR